MPRVPLGLLRLLLALGLLVAGAVRAEVGAAPPLQPLLAAVVLNGTTVNDNQWLHQEVSAGALRFWVDAAEARSWRLKVNERDARDIGGKPHVLLCSGRDRCSYDDSSALLLLTVADQDLSALSLQVNAAEALQPATPSTGAYLNYDLTGWYIRQPGAAGLLEGMVYTPRGHGALRLGGVTSGGRSARTLTQATWQVDWSRQAVSAQVGSIQSPDTSLAAGLALTGLRIGTNAALEPLRPRSLRPLIRAVAQQSQRTDVFVDGQFRQSAVVPYGPFQAELQPLFPGHGQADLISTDLTGKQTRLTEDYYYAPQLLRQGERTWSAGLGTLSADSLGASRHQPVLASASGRQGLSPQLTAQAELLWGRGASRLGLAADTVHPRWGSSSLGLVWQRTPAQPASRVWASAGHEYLSRTTFGAVRAEQAIGPCQARSPTDLLSDRMARPCRQFNGLIGLNIGPRWSLAAAADAQLNADRRPIRNLSLSLRLQAGARSQLAFVAQQVHLQGQSSMAVQVVWSQPIGATSAAQVGVQQQSGRPPSLQWSAQTTPALEPGVYAPQRQVFGNTGPDAEVGARVSDRNDQFDWRAEARLNRQRATTSAGIAGALGLAEGHLFATRRIYDAFVIVDVGLPDLPVLLDNREVARTNAAGWAIVSEARAHQPNVIGVDTSALPLQYALPRDQQAVVPALASGVLARFDVSDGGAAVQVRDERGQKIPSGAVVQVSTQRVGTAVTSRSEVFIERSDRAADVSIDWSGRRCKFRYLPDSPTQEYRCLPP